MRKNRFLYSSIGYCLYSILSLIAFILSKNIIMVPICILLGFFSVIMLKEYKK